MSTKPTPIPLPEFTCLSDYQPAKMASASKPKVAKAKGGKKAKAVVDEEGDLWTGSEMESLFGQVTEEDFEVTAD